MDYGLFGKKTYKRSLEWCFIVQRGTPQPFDDQYYGCLRTMVVDQKRFWSTFRFRFQLCQLKPKTDMHNKEKSLAPKIEDYVLQKSLKLIFPIF